MQKVSKAIFASAALALAIVHPVTATPNSQATLVEPKAGAQLVIVDGRVWKCTGVNCFAPAEGSGQPLARECARVVKVLGKVTAFVRDGVPLDEKRLAACNAGA